MKDKVNTYRHRDSSISIGFSPEEALEGSSSYFTNMNALRDVWTHNVGNYGVRLEWRCGLWAATQVSSLDPQLWV
jgi:hypothetical protein